MVRLRESNAGEYVEDSLFDEDGESLDEKIVLDTGEVVTRVSQVLDPGTVDPVELIKMKEVLDKLNLLDDEERLVIIYRFGLYGNKELTLEEVAVKLGLSRSQVERRERKALRKLRYYNGVRYPDVFNLY